MYVDHIGKKIFKLLGDQVMPSFRKTNIYRQYYTTEKDSDTPESSDNSELREIKRLLLDSEGGGLYKLTFAQLLTNLTLRGSLQSFLQAEANQDIFNDPSQSLLTPQPFQIPAPHTGTHTPNTPHSLDIVSVSASVPMGAMGVNLKRKESHQSLGKRYYT